MFGGLVEQLKLFLQKERDQVLTLSLRAARRQKEDLLGGRMAKDLVSAVENDVDEEMLEELFFQQVFHARRNKRQRDAEQFQAFATGQLTFIVFVMVIVRIRRILWMRLNERERGMSLRNVFSSQTVISNVLFFEH